jgi:hypothetical protein
MFVLEPIDGRAAAGPTKEDTMSQTQTIDTTPGAAPTETRVNGELTFVRPQATKPAFRSAALTGGEPEVLFEVDHETVAIDDMRDIAETLSIDREGFELRHEPTAVADLYDDDAIDRDYVAEIEGLLRRRFNAGRVAVFDVTRRSDDGKGAANRDGRRGPARRVHVDYTAKSGPQRVRDVLGDAEADRLAASGAHVVQVNVWRPIRGPVRRAPLALADASTVRDEELIATDHIYPDRVGEIYHLAHAPAQRWYYASDMTPDEVLLIKGWDSIDDGRARFTPHSAFELPGTDADTPARESIEARALVIVE